MSLERLVGGRFEIERDAGAGAMARVYLARDVSTDSRVALKILNHSGDHTLQRFAREVSALTELDHPGIVKYIAHGRTTAGHPFLAMEWIEGETLETRLERGSLPLEEALSLARGLARALGYAHARGIVHRDVKPANIYLIDGATHAPKLLDFGLVRATDSTFALTATGDLLGTPLFMAPEQASCALDIDARVDVYALGAVLFTCIAGRPPLLAANLVGLLAKIVIEVPVRLAAIFPSVPAPVDDLVARMLAKQRDERPADGFAADAAIGAALSDPLPRTIVVPANREQRVVSILLASSVAAARASLDATIGSFGGVLGLADGSTMVVYSGPETPGDRAARAARFALGLRTEQGSVSLVTGRAVISGPVPVGEVIDRAAEQLARARGLVRLDAETAGLLEGRFEISADEHGATLVAERSSEADPVRTLLGKPTRCIGRDRELAAIEGYYAECAGESSARAVIVIAEAGIGKSRVAHEVMRRFAGRAEPPAIVVARCESINEHSAFAAIASALSRASIEGLVPELAEFLDELRGRSPGAPSERMLAARENPSMMFDHMRTAWIAWLASACDRAPTVLVVEDLHWIDESSLLLLDASLAALEDKPLLVLALARPTVRERKPFATRRPHELRLDPLSRRASERFVREVLADASDELVQNIALRADGNALFIEELVRASARIGSNELPVGVIGTVQLRFDVLEPASRAALRAASVFGEHFSGDGVGALVAGADVATELERLVTNELVAHTTEGFAFRHALVREAAYALIPDEDRRSLHARAAEYLAGVNVEPIVVARHFELGHRNSMAAVWFGRAAVRAFAHNDLLGAIAHASRAKTWSEDPALDLVIAEAEFWRGSLGKAREAAMRAAAALETGAPDWLQAIGLILSSAGQMGDDDVVLQWLVRLIDLEPTDETRSELVLCLSRASSQLVWGDHCEPAAAAFARADALARGHVLGPTATARLEFARAYDELLVGRVDRCLAILRDVRHMYERVGARREAIQMRILGATIGTFVGQVNLDVLVECIEDAERLEAWFLVDWARFELGCGMLLSGRREDGLAQLARVPPHIAEAPLFVAGSTLTSAWDAYEAGDHALLATVLDSIPNVPIRKRYVGAFTAFTAYLTLVRGDLEQARLLAHKAIDQVHAAPGMPADMQQLGIPVAIETLARGGEPIGALVEAECVRLAEIAARIVDPISHRAFLDLTWNRRLSSLRRR